MKWRREKSISNSWSISSKGRIVKSRNVNTLWSIALAIVFLTGAQDAASQVTWGKQTLKRGKLWATVWNSLQYGDPTETSNGFHTLDYPGY